LNIASVGNATNHPHGQGEMSILTSGVSSQPAVDNGGAVADQAEQRRFSVKRLNSQNRNPDGGQPGAGPQTENGGGNQSMFERI